MGDCLQLLQARVRPQLFALSFVPIRLRSIFEYLHSCTILHRISLILSILNEVSLRSMYCDIRTTKMYGGEKGCLNIACVIQFLKAYRCKRIDRGDVYERVDLLSPANPTHT